MIKVTMEISQNMSALEVDVSKKLEDEHLRLQRQVRVIQADRLNQTRDAQPEFRTQNKQLNVLKMEYIELKKNLKIAKSGAHKKKDKRMTSDLKKALLQRLKTLSHSEGGVRLMGQLDGLLQRNNKTVLHLRRLGMASKGKLEERRYESANRLASSENKLEVATLTFNSVQYENKKIREEIEHMLKDRTVFNQVWTKMLASLSKGKKFLSDLFEQTTLAYDQREECCGKLRSMQEKGKVDQTLQMQEMRDLQKVLDHDSRLHDFLAKKGIMRINKCQERKEERLKKKAEEESLEKLNINKEILESIHDYTLEYNVQKIIEDFKAQEVYNFSLYKLTTDICAEIEVLSRSLKAQRRNIIDRCDWNEAKESRQQEKLLLLEEELSQQLNKNKSLEEQLIKHDECLDIVIKDIEEIFKTLECSLEPFQNLLGDKQPSLRLPNLTFSLINEKIKEYIQYVYYVERTTQKKKTDGVTSRLKKYTIYAEPPECWNPTTINLLVPAEPCPQCIEARWMSRVVDKPEAPFVGNMALEALKMLSEEVAYERSDRIHPLTECRLPRSRMILAKRYM